MLTADFSGQHRGSYETYAFLVFDLESNRRWLTGQRAFRESLNLTRRIAFKNMNDGKRRRALLPFLQLAETIDGWLVLFAIPKRGGSLFIETSSQPDRAVLDMWKEDVQEKLLRILHFSSFLISGTSCRAQDLTWIIDEDEIASNANQLTQLTKVFGIISNNSLEHDLGHLRCGTTQTDCGDFVIEDLAAVADLSAGAFCEIANAEPDRYSHSLGGIVTPLPSHLSWKTRVLASWLATEGRFLRKLSYVIQLDKLKSGVGVTALRWHAYSGSLILPYPSTSFQ